MLLAWGQAWETGVGTASLFNLSHDPENLSVSAVLDQDEVKCVFSFTTTTVYTTLLLLLSVGSSQGCYEYHCNLATDVVVGACHWLVPKAKVNFKII